jgi:hypothetical protein
MLAQKGNVMTHNTRKMLALSLSLLAYLVLWPNISRADGLTLTLNQNGVSGDAVFGGVYIDPYGMTLTVGGIAKTVMVIPCDDFVGHINFGETWDVTETSVGNVGVYGPQKFPNNANSPNTSYNPNNAANVPNPTQLPILDPWDYSIPYSSTTSLYVIQRDYAAAAYIASKLITGGASSDNNDNADLSYALWTIFDPSLYANEPNGDKAGVTAVLKAAFQNSNLATLANQGMVLFTPLPDSTEGPQEFIGIDTSFNTTSFKVPESPTSSFLSFNFLALSGVILAVRRRFRAA